MKVFSAAQAPYGGDIHEQTDVLIVGSGAGGATMAYELARAGYGVMVLEAGPHVPSSEFSEHFPDAMARLYVDGGTQLNTDGDISVLQGRCVGGSTVVNAVVAFPIPDWVLEKWASEHGVEGLSPEELAPLYARLEKNLAIHPNAPHEINRNSQLMQRGAEALGWAVKPLARNVRDCALSGYCLAGCRYDRKQSMLVTHLPWALEHGARIVADATVTRIRFEGARATGVEAEIREPESGETKARLRVDARLVVVAAGAVETPLLLRDSGLDNPHIGAHFACHPSLTIPALFDEPVAMWNGAQLGVYVDEFDADARGGFLLEGGGIEPSGFAWSLPGGREEHQALMAQADHFASLVTLIHDRNSGRVYRDGDGRKRIDYRLDATDKPRIRAAIRAAAELWFAAGAREVYLPTVPSRVLRDPADLAAVDALALGPADLQYSSYHPQGTCRMGADPSQSVVNSWGQVHGHDNLLVADASLFPTSVLVNTQLPVYVLATRIAEHVKSRPTHYGLA